MKAIDPKSIAIAASAFYPRWYRGKLRNIKHTDKVRGDLALKFFRIAKENGCRIVVVGRGSLAFRKELKKIKGLIVLSSRQHKRSPLRRLAIRVAANLKGVKVIVLSEPEKVSLIVDCIPLIVEPILNSKADIVVPKRDPKLFQSTYPTYMYESEIEANGLFNEVLRTNGLLDPEASDFDMVFGVRVFKNDPKIISLFTKRYRISTINVSFASDYFDTEEYSNTSYFPVVVALKKRLRVGSVTVPFVYPKKQKENEEEGARDLFLEKRKAQRLGIIVELLHFIGSLGKNRDRRTRNENRN